MRRSDIDDDDGDFLQTPGHTNTYRVPTKTEMVESLTALVERHALKWARGAPADPLTAAVRDPLKKDEAVVPDVDEDSDKGDDIDVELELRSRGNEEDKTLDAGGSPLTEPEYSRITLPTNDSAHADSMFYNLEWSNEPMTAWGSFVSENNDQHGASFAFSPYHTRSTFRDTT